tara:strand:- start:1292 stop:1822 length:531 start_codon:yes stop_codon:yes gene_type:complete
MINTFLKTINENLKNKSYFIFVFFFYAISVLFFIIPFMFIEEFFNYNPIEYNPVSEITNKWVFFILILIVAPIIETLIFQIYIIKGFFVFFFILFEKRMNSDKILWLAIFLSSISFGFFHFYNTIYIIIMSCLGFYWGIVYFFCKKRGCSPFITIAILHFLYNATIYLFEEYISIF